MAIEVQLFDDLDAVAADAGGALDRAARAGLCDRLEWFRLTLAHCPPPGRPLVARARDADGAAWLFLMADRGAAAALGSWYTLRVTMPGFTPALAEAIARALRGRLHRIGLAPVAAADAPGIAAAFARAGWAMRTAAVSANWSIAAPAGGWDAYLAARPGALRATLRRKGRAAPLAIAIHAGCDAAAWTDYEAVYRRSWKPAEGSFPFLRALAEREGAAGTLRLGIARADGRAVAAQLWLTEGGVATLHKLAYVADARRGSPGTRLTAAMIRHAIVVDGVDRIDFGTGDDRYKADWADARRPLHRIDLWDPRTLRGLAGLARTRLGALVRSGAND